MQKKKILFVGASGAVAGKSIPYLSTEYEIIGLSKKNKEMSSYCSFFYTANLLTESTKIFQEIFKKHDIDIIVWNPVTYFPKRLIESSRQILHTEFDIAVALPLECLQIAMKNNFTENKLFIMITSLLAFGYKERWATYSIAKQGQVMLISSLNKEITPEKIRFQTIAFGAVPTIPEITMQNVFNYCIKNTDNNKVIHKVNFDTIE